MAIIELAGFLMLSYGALREALAVLAKSRPYSEGRWNEGPYGGVPPPALRRTVAVGVWLRLLPKDRVLTHTDRVRNAGFIIAGAAVTMVAMLLRVP